MSEYPTTEELRKVLSWPAGDPFGLAGFVTAVWNKRYGRVEFEDSYDQDTQRSGKQLTLVTGGWSGNEDILEALRNTNNFFHMLYWQKSERGGLYEFFLPIEVSA